MFIKAALFFFPSGVFTKAVLNFPFYTNGYNHHQKSLDFFSPFDFTICGLTGEALQSLAWIDVEFGANRAAILQGWMPDLLLLYPALRPGGSTRHKPRFGAVTVWGVGNEKTYDDNDS